jgi:hypothetical protein
MADAAGEADNFGEYLKLSGEREKTWVDFVFPVVTGAQEIGGALGFLAGKTSEAAELTSDFGLVLDENGIPTDESTAALRRRNEAMRTMTGTTQAETDAMRVYTDALVAVNDEEMALEHADIALERSKIRLDEAQARYNEVLAECGPGSREAQEAELNLRDATLGLEESEIRATTAQTDLNAALANVPTPSTGNLTSWLAYYQAIGDKAGYAAAQSGLARDRLSNQAGTGGSRQIPLAARGGHFTGPTSGYLVMLHGEETVLPHGDASAVDQYLPALLASLSATPHVLAGATAPALALAPVASGGTTTIDRSVHIAPGAIQLQVILGSGSQAEALAAADTISDRLLSRLAMGVA